MTASTYFVNTRFPKRLSTWLSRVVETILQLTGKTFTGANTFSGANVHYDTLTIVDADAVTKALAVDCSGMPAGKTLTIKPKSTTNSGYVQFDLGAASAGKGVSFACAATNDRVVTFPDASITVASLAGSEVLENKVLEATCALVDTTDNTKTLKWNLAAQSAGVDITLTSGAESADRLINIPVLGGDQTLAFCALSQVLENKSLEATCALVDTTDNTKTIKWNLAAQSAGVDITITSGAELADRILNIPVLGGDDTIATLGLANAFTGANTHAADEIFLNEKGIRFREATGGGTDGVLVKAPAALAADCTVTLPGVVTTFPATQGAASEVLTNNGAGVLSWAAQSFLQQTATGTVSAASILGANAAAVTLVAAPAAGHIIVVDEIELFLDFGSAAYVRDGGNEELVIQYSGGVDIHAFANATDAFLTAGADARRVIRPTIYNSAAVNFDPTTADQEAVVLFITNSEVITGDSPIKYAIKYRDVTLLS